MPSTTISENLGGDFLGTVVDFLIVAVVSLLVMVRLVGATARKTMAPTVSKICPECLETVPGNTKRLIPQS